MVMILAVSSVFIYASAVTDKSDMMEDESIFNDKYYGYYYLMQGSGYNSNRFIGVQKSQEIGFMTVYYNKNYYKAFANNGYIDVANQRNKFSSTAHVYYRVNEDGEKIGNVVYGQFTFEGDAYQDSDFVRIVIDGYSYKRTF